MQVNDAGKEAMFLSALEQKKISGISQELYDDSNPVFDPGGKYLYFLSKRFFYPSQGDFDQRFNYNYTTGIFALTLKADEAAPFGPQSDEEKEADEKKADAKKGDANKSDAAAPKEGEKPADEKKSEDKPAEAKPADVKPIQIDLDGLTERIS